MDFDYFEIGLITVEHNSYFVGENEIRVGEVTFFPGNAAEIFDPPNSDLEVGKIMNEIMVKNKTSSCC